jgi:hypothetical protein
MKKAGRGVAILLLIAGAVFLFVKSTRVVVTELPRSTNQTENPQNVAPVSSPASRSNSPETTAPISVQPENLAAKATQVVPNSSPDAGPPPETVLQNVQRAIRKYSDMFGGNPTGTNPEITGQLSGNNPRHMNFITAQAGMRVNADGDLVDPWGTPYFFHQLSGAEMEIHSAGPDKTMWTPDDLVVK